MSERIGILFTNEHFAAYCLKMVGHPYWYGTCGYKATSGLLYRKTNQYPTHYGSGRTARYKQDIANREVVCDCIGGAKGYAWTGGGQAMLDAIGTEKSVPSTYGSHGCPDKGANGMFSYAKSKGWAVEWQGFSYGCVKTQVSKRPWTHWYALPFIDYGDAIKSAPVHIPDTPATEYTLGSRFLEKGAKGTDVKTMQELLIQLGCSLPRFGADGAFGNETLSAVKLFQSKVNTKVDGIYGTETHAALMAAIADHDEAQKPSDDPAAGEMPVVQPKKVTIVSIGGMVNIRTGNDTRYSRITAAQNGASFDWIATAQNGWHAIVVNGQVGWVAGEYSKTE